MQQDEQMKHKQAMMRVQDQEIKEKLKGFKNKLLVMSGKGGVGKSTVAAYLAVGLAKKGHQVALMDVDLHGPSIPRLLGLKGTIQSSAESKKGRLTLLGSLPLEPEIVIEGDIGSVAWMDNKDMPYTKSFSKIVDRVADFTR